MKKILFVTTRLIYPINDGRKVVLYNYCRGLAEQHNCEVRLFSLIDEEELSIEQPKFISKIYCSKPPSKYEKIKNLIGKSILFNKWPLQVSLYYSKKAKSNLDRAINDYKPDIVIADMARTAEYLKDLDDNKYNKILDMDDLLSKRYSRQAKSEMLGSSAIGAYSKNVPKFINNILKNKEIAKFVLNKEASLLSKYEIEISNYYKSIIFVSSLEAEEFNKVIGEKKCIDITIGVNYEYFSKNVVRDKKGNYIVFLGNMYVAHNQDAVNKFVRDIFPNILREIPSAKFRIVGRCSDEYKIELEQNVNVEVTGEVDDIRKYVQECNVSVAPLTYGSGIKTKILETMSMGVPIVTNEIGVEGIIKNNYIINENNDEKFAKEVVKLLENKELNEEVSRKSQQFVRENYIWEKILDKFKIILEM